MYTVPSPPSIFPLVETSISVMLICGFFFKSATSIHSSSGLASQSKYNPGTP
nr:MAG TPA: hypothetical protein [Bacteriophage sp.]